MDFVSIRIITDDVARLVEFYEHATGVQASWSNEDFAELTTSSATLAIASTRTVPLFAPGAARPAHNNTVILEFLVDDVDGVRRNWPASSSTSSTSPPRCRGETGRCCFPIPTATSSTSSPPSPRQLSTSSPIHHPSSRGYRRRTRHSRAAGHRPPTRDPNAPRADHLGVAGGRGPRRRGPSPGLSVGARDFAGRS